MQAGQQDVAGGGRTCILAAVDHKNLACRYGLDRLALGMIVIVIGADAVDILTRGNIPQGEGLADHVAVMGCQTADALETLIAQPTLQKLCGQGRGADMRQLFPCGIAQSGH